MRSPMSRRGALSEPVTTVATTSASTTVTVTSTTTRMTPFHEKPSHESRASITRTVAASPSDNVPTLSRGRARDKETYQGPSQDELHQSFQWRIPVTYRKVFQDDSSAPFPPKMMEVEMGADGESTKLTTPPLKKKRSLSASAENDSRETSTGLKYLDYAKSCKKLGSNPFSISIEKESVWGDLGGDSSYINIVYIMSVPLESLEQLSDKSSLRFQEVFPDTCTGRNLAQRMILAAENNLRFIVEHDEKFQIIFNPDLPALQLTHNPIDKSYLFRVDQNLTAYGFPFGSDA